MLQATCQLWDKHLAKPQFDKIFTVAEANSLIPALEIIIRELQLASHALRLRASEIAQSDPATEDMSLRKLIERYPDLRPVAKQVSKLAAHIEELGCLLKDVEQGIVDFPYQAEDETVFLCWQFGEPEVSAWHPIESGFAGRQPLPGARKVYLN